MTNYIGKDEALLPAKILYDRSCFTDPASPYADENRMFQGIPGIACTSGGRLYFTFYTGERDEGAGNYVLLLRSDDGCTTRAGIIAAILPPTAHTRCYDPCLWTSPDGRLWLFWAQSYEWYDGRMGVWCAVCDDPAAEEPRFSEPRRIANGIMMNKPTVTRDGTWLLPCAIWHFRTSAYNDLPAERYSNVYASYDSGKSFSLIGHADYDHRYIDEHMLYETKDGDIVMLIRADAAHGIGMSRSTDGGRTWSAGVDTALGGPCSRFCVRRLSSGRLLLINHVGGKGRTNLTAMLSEDDGQTWYASLLLDSRPDISYPDADQDENGTVYITYDRRRYDEKEILMAVITEDDILAGRCVTAHSRLAVPVNRAYGTPSDKS